MPRKPRYFLPGVATHIVQVGKNHSPVFLDDMDYRIYLESLKKASRSYHCDVHAYALLPNRIHILVTPNKTETISRMVQYIGRYFVPYVNGKYGNKGGLWAGRYKASVIDEDAYLLDCMRFIELNPVRESLVESPEDYKWSSYAANALDGNDPIVVPHTRYEGLGETVIMRRKKYLELVNTPLAPAVMDLIQIAWKSGTPLGKYDFLQHIEKQLNIKVGYYKQGRPKKQPAYS